MAKNMPMLAIFGMFFAIFRPLTGNKTSLNYFENFENYLQKKEIRETETRMY